jgi:hypothetical protein
MAASDHALLAGDQQLEQGNDSVPATDDPSCLYSCSW